MIFAAADGVQFAEPEFLPGSKVVLVHVRAPPNPGHIEAIELLPKDAVRPIASTDRALFNYSDSARIIADGAIWAWGSEGRPLAMAKCWKNRNGSQTCAFSLTSDDLVVARGPQGTPEHAR